MSEFQDMDAPVTRHEMHEALATWAGAINANTKKLIDALKEFLLRELKQHTSASTDELSTRVSVVDEKYKDLPVRVAKLKAKTSAPKQRRSIKARPRR